MMKLKLVSPVNVLLALLFLVVVFFGASMGISRDQALTSRAEAAVWKEAALSWREEALDLSQNLTRVLAVSAYTPTERECDRDPFITASMRPPKEGTVAVSQDLFNQGWVFGKKVRLKGVGIFEINDLMSERYTNRVDILMWKRTQANKFGVQRLEATLLDLQRSQIGGV